MLKEQRCIVGRFCRVVSGELKPAKPSALLHYILVHN